MAYRVLFSREAEEDIHLLSNYLSRYSEDTARYYMNDLVSCIMRNVAVRPLTWQYFYLTGAPFRAYLYKISRRSAYWVVYQVNNTENAVDILRI